MLGWRHLTPGFAGGGILRVKRPSLHVSWNSMKSEVLLIPAVTIPAYALNSHTPRSPLGPAAPSGIPILRPEKRQTSV